MWLIGVGFRCSNQGQLLELAVGYSHPVVFLIPSEIKISTAMEKGTPPTITLESHDLQLLGQVAARIQKIRKPEPYKGKGIKFQGQELRKKAGRAKRYRLKYTNKKYKQLEFGLRVLSNTK